MAFGTPRQCPRAQPAWGPDERGHLRDERDRFREVGEPGGFGAGRLHQLLAYSNCRLQVEMIVRGQSIFHQQHRGWDPQLDVEQERDLDQEVARVWHRAVYDEGVGERYRFATRRLLRLDQNPGDGRDQHPGDGVGDNAPDVARGGGLTMLVPARRLGKPGVTF